MKRLMTHQWFWLFFILFLFVGCATDPISNGCISEISTTYGFFHGFLHGFIILFSFTGKLFDGNIVIYAVNNTGTWYDFGFILGIGT